jgi:sRNA-binding protein
MERAAPTEKGSMSVYFISARELDLVKIGYAHDPVRRYYHLRTFSPVELTLEGAIAGGYEQERQLHQRFALARARGEWFKLTPNLQLERRHKKQCARTAASELARHGARIRKDQWIALRNAKTEELRREIPVIKARAVSPV